MEEEVSKGISEEIGEVVRGEVITCLEMIGRHDVVEIVADNPGLDVELRFVDVYLDVLEHLFKRDGSHIFSDLLYQKLDARIAGLIEYAKEKGMRDYALSLKTRREDLEQGVNIYRTNNYERVRFEKELDGMMGGRVLREKEVIKQDGEST